MDRAGNFVIVWRYYWSSSDPIIYYKHYINDGIFFQRYNSSGIAQGVNIKVTNDGFVYPGIPSIAMDRAGNFVIVWEDYRTENYPANSDIYYQQYNSSGTVQGVYTKVNDDTIIAYQESPLIAMDGAGNFVIVWEDNRNGNTDIYYQRFDGSGNAQGTNIKVNDDLGSSNQNNPSISIDSQGNFVIVWEDYRYGLNNPDIIGQMYFPNGLPNGSNYRIVADGPNHGERSPVVAVNNNTIIFSWVDNRRSKGWDIYAKIVDWNWEGEIPVELSTFEGSVVGNDVELNWTTATETNNLGFEVQKKVKDEFVKITFVNGHGTTTQVSNYSFVDKDVTPGKYSYRLKQIDYNGTFEYSKIVEVNVGSPKTFSLSQNYPNPFNPVTKITYAIPLLGGDERGGLVTLKVYDILGNEVANLVNEVKPAGSYEIDFDAANLPSGVYFYQLRAGDFVQTKKMILLR